MDDVPFIKWNIIATNQKRARMNGCYRDLASALTLTLPGKFDVRAVLKQSGTLKACISKIKCADGARRDSKNEYILNVLYFITAQSCDLVFEWKGCYTPGSFQSLENVYGFEILFKHSIANDSVNWKNSMTELACRCAREAMQYNFKVFALQFPCKSLRIKLFCF